MQYLKLLIALLIRISSVHSSISFFPNENHEKVERCLKIHSIERWITQEATHLDQNDKKLFKMRYFEYGKHFKPNGPIIVYLGTEHRTGTCLYSFIQDIARDLKATIIMPEHRYYGQSMPTSNDYKYLSARETIADIVGVVKMLKLKTEHLRSKVLMIGHNLAGNLAMWTRMLNPKVIDAVLASSAPTLAKIDYTDFLDLVTDNYKSHGGGDLCIYNIKEKFKRYTDLLKSNEGREQLRKEENICKSVNLTKTLNQQHFIWGLLYTKYALYPTYGSPTLITKFCSDVNSANLARSNSECLDCDFDNYVRSVKNYRHMMADSYRYCNEYGHFWIPSDKQIFGKILNLQYYVSYCQALFGAGFNVNRIKNGIRDTNNYFGGKTPRVSRVLFTHGSLDPYKNLGILSNISLSNDVSPAVIISDVTNHQDLMNFLDPPPKQLERARAYIKNVLKKWIS